MARETAAEKKAREAAEAAPQPEESAEAPVYDGVFIIVQRNPDNGDITGLDTVPQGDVRKTEIGDILSLAEALHARQIKQ